ncbi:14828_t:CDS:2 [Entrophospora sp. SA101]|nr:13219_t:CDS:2 [Entrophospora sp. SA101]CAJ0751202.1 14828_t:CDS:2 [Entrophospora sp. SA101]
MQIIATDIEWTYLFVWGTTDEEDKGSWRKKLKSKRLDFEESSASAEKEHGHELQRAGRDGFADVVSVVVNDKGKGREEEDESLDNSNDIERSMNSHEGKSRESSYTE